MIEYIDFIIIYVFIETICEFIKIIRVFIKITRVFIKIIRVFIAYYKQLFELIILYIKTILSKINFDFFVRAFVLIIDFKMLNNEKIILNIEIFVKKKLYENDELKITIERNENKKIINSKNVLNKNFCCNFDKCVFIFCCTKNIILFF